MKHREYRSKTSPSTYGHATHAIDFHHTTREEESRSTEPTGRFTSIVDVIDLDSHAMADLADEGDKGSKDERGQRPVVP